MYRCFNLYNCRKQIAMKQQLDAFIQSLGRHYESNFGATAKERVASRIDDYFRGTIEQGDILDGDQMQSEYFAPIKADIFLSHSHDDEDIAFRLKFIFERIFGLSVFVDSYVWGYCNDLLRKIDDRYCYQEATETYDYSKRNNTTAAVHIMLSTALTTMLDQCECIMFLNTDKSNMSAVLGNNVQTSSPWIFHELSTIRTLRTNKLDPTRKKKLEKRTFTMDEAANPLITHTLSLNGLSRINIEDLLSWLKSKSGKRGTVLLDEIYNRDKFEKR